MILGVRIIPIWFGVLAVTMGLEVTEIIAEFSEVLWSSHKGIKIAL